QVDLAHAPALDDTGSIFAGGRLMAIDRLGRTVAIEDCRVRGPGHMRERLARAIEPAGVLLGAGATPLVPGQTPVLALRGVAVADIGTVISEFPVTYEAAEIAKERGLMIAMGAPNAMRGKSYSGNLSAREAHAAGLLHILAADYHPAAILPAIRALASQDPDGLVGAVRLASKNPAKALGLADRGEIATGKRA
ncbi:MAG: hypothetical protein AAFZ09_21275, partial [Pseudomonadota bacterium]